MDTKATPTPGAHVPDIEDYWARLNDEELRRVVWTTDKPQALPNLRCRVPIDLPDFIIELEYRLDTQVDAPVPCAHCPHHQAHWHGFVLLASDGTRYLLGSHCGPRAYKSDYFVASTARNRAKKRAGILQTWDALRGRLPDLLEALADAEREPSFATVRRFRGAWLNNARGVRDALHRLPRNHLTGAAELKISGTIRDLAAEKARDEWFQAEAAKLAHLPNKVHRLAVAELRQRIGAGEIWRTVNEDFGVLRGDGWLVPTESPFNLLSDITKRLRGYHVVGAATQDKQTAKLEQFVRETRKDIELAVDQFIRIGSASAFFAPDHLNRLCGWAERTFTDDTKRRLAIDAGELIVAEGYNQPQSFRLPADWHPPGTAFLELAGAGRSATGGAPSLDSEEA
jgi:hypothetical protein